MARTSHMWWPWVQRNLDARGWKPADLAREIRAELGHGPDESVIGRWRNKGATPTRESVRAVAAVFHRDVREALVAAGLVTARELDAAWADPSRIDLTIVPDEALAEEVAARLVRRTVRSPRRPRQPATANGRTTIAPTSADSRHAVPADAEMAPPLSEESEGAVNADCA